MTDQRLPGFSHEQLYRMAHGGDPGAAEQAGTRLSRAAETLRGISETLERTAARIGVGWSGQAAEAARGGIGTHARWAETAGQRARLAGTAAAEQAISARHVITQMPPPRPAPSGGGGSPVGVNAAEAEAARANDRRRAIELMKGHADVTTRTRPNGQFLQAPTAGGAGAAGVPGGRGTGGGRVGRVGGPAEATAPAAGAAAGSRPVASTPTGPRTGSAGAGRGMVAGSRGASVPPGARQGPVVTGAAAGRQARPGPGIPLGGVARGGTDLSGTRRARPQDHHGPHPGTVPTSSPTGTPSDPLGDGTHQQTTGPDRPGRAGAPGEPSGGTSPGVAMAPPLCAGGVADVGGDQGGHRRLGFLLDDDSIFNGDGSVTPPVIGA